MAGHPQVLPEVVTLRKLMLELAGILAKSRGVVFINLQVFGEKKNRFGEVAKEACVQEVEKSVFRHHHK